MQSAWGSPEIAANTSNTFDQIRQFIPGSYLSNKANYFWSMGDRPLQTGSTVYYFEMYKIEHKYDATILLPMVEYK